MNAREKLVEILKQAPFEGKVLDEWWWEEKIRIIADYLIDHGVTVQEWVSVDDRLPDAGGYVVCIEKRNPFSRFMPMVARIEKNGWANPITEQYISEVTHWMPLPEPPEEDAWKD